MTRTLAIGSAVALAALVALWAAVSYLQPAFTGDLAGALLRCN
jgi:hypothetical protein